jgi:hypothetical protein
MLRWMLTSLALVACGKGATAGGEQKIDLDADPLALLAPAPVLVGNANARAIFDSPSFGGEVAALTERLVPLGERAGFRAARDVDRVVFATYATGGAGFAVVLNGRFDPAKIDACATSTSGAPIVRGVYADRTTYTAGPIQYAVLSARTLVAGSGDGFYRVLDRVRERTFGPSVAAWVVETMETKGAEVALTADFDAHPIASAALGSLNLSWLQGMHVARILGSLEPPGMSAAATLGFATPEQAQTAVAGIRSIEGWLRMLGPVLGGIRLPDLEVMTQKSDLRCTFTLDDQTIRAALALAPRFLPSSP